MNPVPATLRLRLRSIAQNATEELYLAYDEHVRARKSLTLDEFEKAVRDAGLNELYDRPNGVMWLVESS